MSAVFTAPDASVIGAVLTLAGVLAGLYVQNRKAHRQNHAEHAATFELVREVAADVKEVRADQREQGAEIRSHGDRLRRLELGPEPTPARVKPETRNRKKAT